jgi:hypothetical protein
LLDANVPEILSRLTPSDLVLDVGGWACPFNRANWVMDAEAYETRGYYRSFGGVPYQAGDKEWFSEATWIRRDVCDKEPFPFADKQIDFAICSHTLEDVRDPLWVCSELMRVAKRGYIEVPSREWEPCRGLERPGQVGLSHHRWLIDIDAGRLRFVMKYHMIHSHWRFSFPHSHASCLPSHRAVQWLWWENSFEFEEVTIHGVANQERELESFVESIRPYPLWRCTVDRQARRMHSFLGGVTGKLKRMLVGKSRLGPIKSPG